MVRDYEKEAEEYDRSLHPNGDEPDLTPEEEPDLTPDVSNLPDDGVETAQEETVPKAQYDAAVREMNAVQRELAALRKQQSAKPETTQQESEPDGDEVVDSTGEPKKPSFDDLLNTLEDEGFGEFVEPFRLLKKHVDDKLSQLGGVTQQLHTDAFWNTLRQAMPDLDSFIPPSDKDYADYTDEQKQYADWYAAQDQDTKDLFAEGNSPEMVILGLKKFRADVPKQEVNEESPDVPEVAVVVASKPEKPSKLEQARAEASPMISTSKRGNDKKIPTSMDEIRKMSNEDFFANEDEILNS